MAELRTAKNILIAPLNWGLGHATRCIPIINALLANGFTPILASDGAALELLKKEFPTLRALALPSYKIQYAKNASNFKWKMLRNLPRIIKAISNEKKIVSQWIEQYNLSGIISDNRPGVVSKKIPSVYITHQLNVLTGNTTWLTSKLHRMTIRKFSECWIPDTDHTQNLSGKLGHSEKPSALRLKYIGPLSRFEKKPLPIKYDLMILLSGPEPQRSILETQLKNQIGNYQDKIVLIKGIVEAEQKKVQTGNVTFYNFMTSTELEKTFNESKIVLSRSGYTTIMDLAKLGKKSFFIPTPGQYEQEYLAKKLKEERFAPYVVQHDFTLDKLTDIKLYTGLPTIPENADWDDLFGLFESH